MALAFETSCDCIKMIKVDGTLVLLNAGGAAAMGFESPAVPVGENWIDFWTGEEREAARAAVSAAASGLATTVRGYLPTATGLPRWWESTVTPLVSSSGPPTHLLVISRDVTGQRAAERAERLWERRHRTLIEATSQIVWSLDAATGAFESRGWQGFTGRPREASDAGTWLDAIHPEDRALNLLAVDPSRRGSRARDVSYRLLSASGEWRWVEDHATPLEDDDGAQVGWVGVVTDVHARRVPDQRMRDDDAKLHLALDSASLGMWDLDLRTGECRLSPEARRIVGLERDGADGSLLDVLHPDDRDAVVARHAANRRQTEGTSLTNFRIVRPDTGETRWIAARGRAVLDHEGGVVRRVGTFEDFTERELTKLSLRSTLRRHRALLDAVSVIVWHSDAGQVACEREGWAKFTGWTAEARWLDAVHPDDRARVEACSDQGRGDAAPYGAEYRLAHVDGGHRWVKEDVVPLLSDDGSLEGWVGVVSDVHERRMAELALAASERRLRLASEVTGLGTYDVNVATGARDRSPEFHDLLRLPRTTVPDRRLFLAAVHPDDRARVEREWNDLGEPEVDRPNLTFRLRFGADDRWMETRERVLRDHDGRPSRRIGTMQDVTERKRVEHELWTAAHADALTGVANRTLFQARLEQAVGEADRDGTEVGVILVDVDNFKQVNDAVGHAAGDAVLRTVADRLRLTCPAEATVGRLGGDEFGVVLPGVRDRAAPGALAGEALLALRRPLVRDGRELECTSSVGWSTYPGHDRDASALLRNADMALYAAKRAGRNRVAGFDAGLRDDLRRRVDVLRRAKDAIARDAVVPHYQPKVSLRTGRVVGFEALLRWTDASGLRPPSDLQEAFSDPELACRLGAAMLRRVVADMRAWTESGVPFGHVALNAGAPELHRPGFADGILGALAAASLPTTSLEVEVTEGVLLDDATEAVAKALRVLHEAGVAVSLDDFGTGYASLTHLRRFPVKWLKIDRSFVSNMEPDNGAKVIVKAVVGLAHNLGLRTVAEGVETSSQQEFLTGIGCDLGQGYLFAKPMPAALLPDFLAKRNVRRG